MTNKFKWAIAILFLMGSQLQAQKTDVVVDNIVKEATKNSQLEILAHELLDVIGSRLVGTPQMKHAHDWAVAKYEAWGIPAKNEQWGNGKLGNAASLTLI